MPIDVMEIVKIVKKVKPLFFVEDKRKNISEKGITDFVTEVDYAVQRYLRERLDKRYPDIQLMSEEKSNQDIDFSKPLWILDPVDGTTNFDSRFPS
jgi:myo-inositol-1(or 4)-monophosphatase